MRGGSSAASVRSEPAQHQVVIATHVLANGLPENAGFTIAFLLSAIGAVIAGLSVLLIPGRRSRQSVTEPRQRTSVAARASA